MIETNISNTNMLKIAWKGQVSDILWLEKYSIWSGDVSVDMEEVYHQILLTIHYR